MLKYAAPQTDVLLDLNLSAVIEIKKGCGWLKGRKLTAAVCVQVWILGSGEGVCRGAKL